MNILKNRYKKMNFIKWTLLEEEPEIVILLLIIIKQFFVFFYFTITIKYKLIKANQSVSYIFFR